MYSELETYVRRYYDDWLRCSRRWCSMNGIPQEAYDLLADVLESLCRKSDALLSDMLSHENNGDKRLFYYVRKALRYTIGFISIIHARHSICSRMCNIPNAKQKYRTSCSIHFGSTRPNYGQTILSTPACNMTELAD